MGDVRDLLPDTEEDCPPPQPPTTKLKISAPLTRFPNYITNNNLADTLEHLDLSGTGLSSLPASISRLAKLRVAFFSGCAFAAFPPELAPCPSLEVVAFRGNGMREVPEGSLPASLCWLILTNNRIRALPRTVGRCARLRKCMLAGNELGGLPDEMAACRSLGLLRLSANRIRELPRWLFEMPELAFLSFAGNPCCYDVAAAWGSSSSSDSIETPRAAELARVSWFSLGVEEVLGEGASGVISKGTWDASSASAISHDQSQPQPQPHPQAQAEPPQQVQVAIKLFRGGVTSDGRPSDEMRACMQAGSHANLIDPLGQIHEHPEGAEGLVMQLVPPSYRALGQPPSLQTCTRDCFPPPAASLTTAQALGILRGVAGAAAHVHGRGVAHGDLYAHNILFNDEGHALLGDFGAASTYRWHHPHRPQHHHPHPRQHHAAGRIEQIEVLAFAHLIEDVSRLIRPPLTAFEEREFELGVVSMQQKQKQKQLAALHRSCAAPVVADRPSFSDVRRRLSEIEQDLGLGVGGA